MNDAILQWAQEVKNSEFEADSLRRDVSNLEHQVVDLVHAIRDLGMIAFDPEAEPYVVLEKSRGLWQLVSDSVAKIRRTINDATSEVHDLKRAAEFYKP